MLNEGAKERAEEIERAVNVMGDHEDIGYYLANMHPTLVQDFMRIAVSFIMQVPDSPNQDFRNQQTLIVCERLRPVLEKHVVEKEVEGAGVKRYSFSAPHI